MERLTKAVLDRAIREEGGQPAAWYHLAQSGYLPDEIALWTTANYPACEVRSIIRRWATEQHLPIPTSCALRIKSRTPAPPPLDWREAFQTHVMRTGLALTLTQPQLELLCAIADHVQWDRGRYFRQGGMARPDCFISTGAALAKRGLVANHFDEKGRGHGWQLTPAGQAVVELLKVCGVFVIADAALEKQA